MGLTRSASAKRISALWTEYVSTISPRSPSKPEAIPKNIPERERTIEQRSTNTVMMILIGSVISRNRNLIVISPSSHRLHHIKPNPKPQRCQGIEASLRSMLFAAVHKDSIESLIPERSSEYMRPVELTRFAIWFILLLV